MSLQEKELKSRIKKHINMQKHGEKVENLQHAKEIGIVYYNDEKCRDEFHWSQCNGIGKFDFLLRSGLNESEIYR